MGKYRILEIPQPDGSNKYRINICVLKAKPNFWFMKSPKDRIIETWHVLNEYGYRYFIVSITPELTPKKLQDFDTLKQAKDYLEYLKKAPKVVYSTA